MATLGVENYSRKLLELVQRFAESSKGWKKWHNNLLYENWLFL